MALGHISANWNNLDRAGSAGFRLRPLVTTLVLVAGFGTFAFASYMPNVNIGILTALILSTALLTDLLLLPALLLRRRSLIP
ncbi:MAG: hypothetical protein GY856_52470 [bacterium]|nr:hypothetical protein [bacterium]